MRVLVAGATGALGRPLVARLVAGGHEVTGLTRFPHKRAALAREGVRPLVADVLTPGAAVRATDGLAFDAVVHALTAIGPAGPMRFGDLDQTNRLRRHGTAALLDVARATGARRVVAESMVLVYGYEPAGALPLTELAPLGRADRPAGAAELVAALRSLEEQVVGARDLDGIALRFGMFYGPGANTGALARMLRTGLLRLPAGADGVASWIHTEDAADAVVAALERGRPHAVYNVADDHPVTWEEFLTGLAAAAGTRPPRRAPAWLLGLMAPAGLAAMRARLPMSNATARAELGWTPRHPSWREGLATLELGARRAS